MLVAAGKRALSGLCLLALAGAHSSHAQEFRSGVEMVALAVTVTDGKGRAVTGLSARDFTVLDEGVRQEVALFGSQQVPLDVMLVLDSSSSMGAALPAVKSGARGLLGRLRAGDRASLVEIKTNIGVPESLVADIASVDAAVERLAATGETALYDGLYLSLRQFEQERRVRPAELRRQALVLFSDGIDTASRMGFDEVAGLARAMDVTIYSITFQQVKRSNVVPEDRISEARWQMSTLTRDTGGLAYFPKQVWELDRIYDTIAREIVDQYALAYVAPLRAEGQTFRRVSIGLVPPARGVPRTRAGYVVALPPRANAAAGSHR